MKRFFQIFIICLAVSNLGNAQTASSSFGKGLRYVGKDSTFYLKAAFRFQNLHTSQWELEGDKVDNLGKYEGGFLVRRARFKFSGWVMNPKLTYKFEVGLSNRDLAGGAGSEFGGAPKSILDASLEYKFYKNFSILFGQRKLPGNRERVISSANLQFVDRSRLNSRFNIDRDVGIQLKHYFTIGKVLIREVFAFSQGEGRNVTAGNFEGYEYTFRGEILPFGEFASKGDYIGSAIKKEKMPKLSLGITYDINDNAVRERGNNGNFIKDDDGKYYGKTLHTFFLDMMFKYGNYSFMGEFAQKKTSNDVPTIFDGNGTEIGTFYTGTGLNLQMGYMLRKNYEVATRYTVVNPKEEVGNDERHYTFGVSKYIVGHKLKVQSDASLIEREQKNDYFLFRLQLDVHF